MTRTPLTGPSVWEGKDIKNSTRWIRELSPDQVEELGHVASLNRLLDTYGAPYGGQVHCDLVMGVPGGMPGTTAALVAAVAELPAGCSWSATGIGRTSLAVALASLSAGGHLRVGMEDTLTFAKGQPVTGNDELVHRAAELARLAQRPPMTTEAARAKQAELLERALAGR